MICALQQTDRLDVLSRPQVMTLNNQPAFVQVGQQVPIVQSTSQTAFGQVNNVNLVNVGILLGVTPRISPDGLVVMEIDAEKSELSGDGVPISFSDSGVLESPIIDTTRAQTTVSARSGQTVILGGLITKNRLTSTSSVPYLGDIPVVGNLFRFDSASEERTELLIIMTPYIVRKAEDANELNQIEAQRMSWCLADVVDVHGDVGFISGGAGPGPGSAQVIYPDRTPTIAEPLPEWNESLQQAPLPQPADGLPMNSHESPSDWDAARNSPRAAAREESSGRDSKPNMLARFRQRLRGKSTKVPSPDDAKLANDRHDRAAVSRVQYIKSQVEPDSSATDRRRLPMPE